MNPIKFEESNQRLTAPRGWDEGEKGPCEDLHVFTDGEQCISLWRPTWRERLSVLFRGRVWLYVVAGRTQPPVAISGTRTVFTTKPRRMRSFAEIFESAWRRVCASS